jgi:hypothetical protein
MYLYPNCGDSVLYLTPPSVSALGEQSWAQKDKRRDEVPLLLTGTVYVKDDVKSWNGKKDLLLIITTVTNKGM